MLEGVVLVVLSVTIPSVYGKVTPNYMKYEFRFSTNTVSWSTAWATCQEHSQSDLVDMKDSVKIKALEHLFSTPETSAMKGPMWIGLHYVQSVTGGQFQWSDCQPANETVPWMTGEPNSPDVSSCITAGRRAFMGRTQDCSDGYVFVCQKVNGDCSYTSFKNKICDTKERRVILEGQLSHDECRDRCSMEKSGSDLCWAFERDKTSSKCTLIFSPNPYVCESQVSLRDTDSAARNCFEFSDITGKKEKVVESNSPVSACVSTVTATTTITTRTSTTAAAATSTTAPSTTTYITTTHSTTEANPTQSSTSSTAGLESTQTEVSTVTTTTTAITTMAAISEPSTVTTANMSTASTTESPAVTTAATSATTTLPSTTAASDTDTPTSTPFSSRTSTASFSSNVTGGAVWPALDTFLSRLEAALTSPRSAPTQTRVTSPGRYVYEACVAVQTFTILERKKRTDDIVTDLTLDKKNLSSYRRKKSSAEDERPSAQSVGGGVAIILLVTAALIIILPDCASILMHVMHIHKKKQLFPAQQ